MPGYRPRRGFQDVAARRLVAPRVQAVADRAADAAREFAPGTKSWVHVGDDRVRPEHREAGGQTVPDNVRFLIRTPEYDRRSYPHEWQQMKAPRDRVGGTIGNTVECRCSVRHDPEGVARTISARPVTTSGTHVEAKVVCTHPRAADAEFGNDVDEGARFMARGGRTAAGK